MSKKKWLAIIILALCTVGFINVVYGIITTHSLGIPLNPVSVVVVAVGGAFGIWLSRWCIRQIER